LKQIISAGFLALLTVAGLAFAQSPQTSEGDVIVVPAPSGVGIRALIRQVAEDEGIDILVDPRVNARVEIAGNDLEDADLETLLAILRVHGYVMVEIGGQLAIVLDAWGRLFPVRILQDDDPSVSDHIMVSRVISVGEGGARLIPILRPLISQYGIIAATEQGAILVVARYDKVREITALVEELTE
jgi:type II secretory pathway component GspD/PulD (secretin)